MRREQYVVQEQLYGLARGQGVTLPQSSLHSLGAIFDLVKAIYA